MPTARGVGWRRAGGALGRRSVWSLRALLALVVVAIAVAAAFADATVTFGCGAAVLVGAVVWSLVLSADQQRQVWGLARPAAPVDGPVEDEPDERGPADKKGGSRAARSAAPPGRPGRRTGGPRRRKKSSATVRRTRPGD